MLFYVFEAIRARSAEVFTQIPKTFEATLNRDPEFKKLLAKIGSSYLGIVEEKPMNLMSMLSGLMG